MEILNNEMDRRAPKEELKTMLDQQALVNEALCAENCLGRWIWKSGNLKSLSVPWEVQAVNTCPDNFLWDKNQCSIITVAPGLYEISFGFYAKKMPEIEVHVNSEPILGANHHVSSTVTHISSGRLRDVGRHSAGNITGLTLLDFVALPARARVSVVYSGEAMGEGFISLKKL